MRIVGAGEGKGQKNWVLFNARPALLVGISINALGRAQDPPLRGAFN